MKGTHAHFIPIKGRGTHLQPVQSGIAPPTNSVGGAMPDYIGAAMAFNFLLFSFAFITAIATSSGEFFRGDFEATSLFGATANSTCGDPPTNFNYNGQLFNCTAGEHASSFAVDGNPDTWWQSTNEEDPVELVFSLIEVYRF